MLPLVVTYWHDHVWALNPQTPSLLRFTSTQAPLLVTLRFHTISNDLDATTMFYQRLIVDLAPVDSCVVRRYKTSQISQRLTYKSSKSLQNVARIFLLYVEKLEWNPKLFPRLGPNLKICRISMPAIFDWLSLILDQSSSTKIFFLFLKSAELETNTFKHWVTTRLDMFCSRFVNTIKIWF